MLSKFARLPMVAEEGDEAVEVDEVNGVSRVY
jgi:hypothetical protein